MATMEQQAHSPVERRRRAGEITGAQPGDRRRGRSRAEHRRGRTSRSSSRARASAQPIWSSLGFEGRAAIMRDFRRWLVAQPRPPARDHRRRERQDARGRSARRARLHRRRARLLGEERGASYLTDRAHAAPLAVPARPQARRAPPALRRGRRDRPVELPADQQLRRLHPRAHGRQHRGAQAGHAHAADARCSWPRACAPDRAARTTSSRSPPAAAATRAARSSTTRT